MSVSLQRLRELLSFAHPSGDTVALSGMTGDSRHDALVHIYHDVLPQIARQRGRLQRFRQLEAVCQEIEPALAELECQTSAAPLPLSPAARTSALQVDNLIKRLAQCYADIAHSASKRSGNETAPLFYRATQRVITLLARRQLLAHRACALPSARSWLQLHALYQMTCHPGRQALNGDTAPIEHEYLGALLLAYFDPQRQPRGDLDTVYRCARQLAPYAVVSVARREALAQQTTSPHFLVRVEEAHPGLPLSHQSADEPKTGGLLIDCTEVLAAIDRNLAHQPGQTLQPELAAPPALLQSLRLALDGRSARRFGRIRFRPRADLVNGLDEVIAFLDGGACSRRLLDTPEDGNPRPFVSGEWSLVNESPDGFLARFVRGKRSSFGVGQIVALQPRESCRTHVCLVRRVIAGRNRLELGLQLLSPQVSVVILPDGDRAIFLHGLPAWGAQAGLIVSPNTLRSGQQLSLKIFGQTIERRIGRVMEANEGLEFFTLEQPS
ncbi:MAG: hypothetical protein LBV49_08905 [Azonexus sp.]|jgi:hypothetical protein|nr:hypothetical protein [Azonexus sp.]